jgi:hypothetical protein
VPTGRNRICLIAWLYGHGRYPETAAETLQHGKLGGALAVAGTAANTTAGHRQRSAGGALLLGKL